MKKTLCVNAFLVSCLILASGLATIGLAYQSTPCLAATAYSVGIDPFQDESDLVETYVNDLYYTIGYGNPAKTTILNYTLPYADIWHFSGHGGQNELGKNYLVAGDSNNIWPGDIPDLNGSSFPQMRFAFGSACYAGDSDWWQDDLPEAFLDEGAEAYIGWHGSVDGSDSYDFCDVFYFLTTDAEWSVRDAADWAEDLTDTNIDCHGDDVSLIP